MIAASPFAPDMLFTLGPIPIGRTVVTTWGLMAAMVVGCAVAQKWPGRARDALDLSVQTITDQVEEVVGTEPRPFVPLIGTLFVFLLVANLSAVVPGIHAPTARLETAAALALVVFLAVHWYGIRRRGVGGYLAHYLKPTPLLLPLNLLSELTRTLSLMVRLFGNMMSHELMLAILLGLAGLLVPIPIMALGVLIGVIQAYIFTILALVFLGAAIGSVQAH